MIELGLFEIALIIMLLIALFILGIIYWDRINFPNYHKLNFDPIDPYLNYNQELNYQPVVYKKIELTDYSKNLNELKESNILKTSELNDLTLAVNALSTKYQNLIKEKIEEEKAHDLIITSFASELGT